MTAWIQNIKNTLLSYAGGRHLVNRRNQGIYSFIQYSPEAHLPAQWYFNAHHIKNLILINPLLDKKNKAHTRYYKFFLSDKNSEKRIYFYQTENKNFFYAHSPKDIDFARNHFNRLLSEGGIESGAGWFNRANPVDIRNYETRRLDSLITENTTEDPFGLYVHTPDAVIDILRGSDKLLINPRLFFIHLSTSALPYFSSSDSREDIITHLRKCQFTLLKEDSLKSDYGSERQFVFMRDEIPEADRNFLGEIYK